MLFAVGADWTRLRRLTRVTDIGQGIEQAASVEACLEFLKKHPRSAKAKEVRDALFGLVQVRLDAADPKLAALRVLFEAGASGPVGLKFEGETPEAWRNAVLAAISGALSDLGLTTTETPGEEATLRFGVVVGPLSRGSDGADKGWGVLFEASGQPLRALGTLSVRAVPAAEPVWRIKVSPECGGVWFKSGMEADAEVERLLREDVCRQLNAALQLAR